MSQAKGDRRARFRDVTERSEFKSPKGLTQGKDAAYHKPRRQQGEKKR